MPPPPPQTWTRQIRIQDDGSSEYTLTYTISTDPGNIDLDAVDAAFRSDVTYWAKPASSREALRTMVEHSFCFGLFARTEEEKNGEADGRLGYPSCVRENGCGAPQSAPLGEMIGFARLVTDYTTFAYLTDVYVLPAHQGRGLGKWLIRCINELLSSWPDLRRCILFTRGEQAVRMYARELEARSAAETDAGLVLMEKAGMGAVRYGGEKENGVEGGKGKGEV